MFVRMSMPSIDISIFGEFAPAPVPGISFCRISQPSKRLPPPFRFLLGNVPNEVLDSYFRAQGLSSAGVFIAHGMSLVGEFLLMRGNTIFKCPELNIHPAHIENAIGQRDLSANQNTRKYLAGQYAFLAGPGNSIYGHWLVEHLPRLAVLHEAGFDVFKLKYLVPSTTPAFALAWLTLLGIKQEQLVIYNPDVEVLQPEELLLPTILHNGHRVSPFFNRVAHLFKAWVAKGNVRLKASGTPPRLFVSRRNASQSRRMINRDRIEKMAEQAGFAILYPEQHPLWEQVRIFGGAKVLVGEYGSALHGSIFSETGTVVCCLRGNALHPGFIQSGVGHALGQPTGYLFGETNTEDPEQSFTLPEDVFDAGLKWILGGGPLDD
jgi:Glycosyltransferase 61